MSRHAYCILAHNEPAVFIRLIHSLDHEFNDIYVHIDKKTDIAPFKKASCFYSKLCFTKERLNCSWGTPAIVEVELMLLEEAAKNGDYSYFHIISGVDLPIKSQEFIHHFIDDLFSGYNYIGILPQECCKNTVNYRTSTYHLFTRRPNGSRLDSVLTHLNNLFICLQKTFGVKRKYPFDLFKGPQWVSISNEFCNYLIDQKKAIINCFKHTRCADEIFIQSVFMGSGFKNTLFRPSCDEYEQCMREIDWERGSPYTWKDEDYDYLMKSERWFARKFSSSELGLIDRILESIKDQS